MVVFAPLNPLETNSRWRVVGRLLAFDLVQLVELAFHFFNLRREVYLQFYARLRLPATFPNPHLPRSVTRRSTRQVHCCTLLASVSRIVRSIIFRLTTLLDEFFQACDSNKRWHSSR
jgi:hypothetical protein